MPTSSFFPPDLRDIDVTSGFIVLLVLFYVYKEELPCPTFAPPPPPPPPKRSAGLKGIAYKFYLVLTPVLPAAPPAEVLLPLDELVVPGPPAPCLATVACTTCPAALNTILTSALSGEYEYVF